MEKKHWQEFGMMMFYMALVAAGAVINFLLNQRIATVLGAARYGDFAVALSVLWVLGVISVLGFDYFISIELPRVSGRGRGGKKGIKLLVGLFEIATPVIILLVVVGVFLLVPLLLSKHINAFVLFRDVHPVMYFIWAAPIFGVYKYFIGIMRARGWYAISLVVDSIVLPILIFTAFLFLVTGSIETTRIILAPVIIVIGLLLAFGIGSVFFFKQQHLSLSHIYSHLDLDKKQIIKTSVKFLLATFIVNNSWAVVLLILEIVGHNEESVGFVSACFQCLAVAFLMFSSLELVLLPKFAKALHHNHLEQTQRLVTISHIVAVLVATIVCAVLYIHAAWLLSGFGAEFNRPLPLHMLRVGILLALPTYFVGYSDNVIAARAKNATLVFKIAVVYSVAVVLIAIPLTYYFYGMGAIVAVFGMNILYYVFYTVLLYRQEKLRPI